MDCEKFDQHVMDALYDELDELTHAALKRHVEGCSRCATVYAELRATREVGVLPLEEPSDELEARILEAALVAQKKTPWPRKLLRGLAWAGSHAMRPQLAMAALFFLVIGSSLLLLRARPGTIGGPVRVTQHGAPSPEQPEAIAEAAMTAAPAAAPSATATAVAMAEGQRDQPDEKAGALGKARGADKDADPATVALSEARATRASSGCSAAVGKLDDVGARYPGTAAAADAMWEAASCYKSMGNAARARELFLALRSSPGYRDRAEREIGTADNNIAQNQAAPTAAPLASAPATVAAAPPPAAKPKAGADETMARKAATKPPAGGGPGARAAPAPVKAPARIDSGF